MAIQSILQKLRAEIATISHLNNRYLAGLSPSFMAKADYERRRGRLVQIMKELKLCSQA
jgi:hypothetical protein